MTPAQHWIHTLGLEPHPEGGYYKRIYTNPNTLETTNGPRSLATSIHFLLEANDYSAWHRIKSDELWYFHDGAPLTIRWILPTGQLISETLSPDQLMVCVPANTWFCAELADRARAPALYSLVSCVVTPGFDFADFEMGDVEDLVTLYPQHRDVICRLCR